MIALLDADVVLYRAAFSVEHKEYWIEGGVNFRRLSDLVAYYAWNSDMAPEGYEYDNKNKLYAHASLPLIVVESKPILEPVENAYYNASSMIDSILARTEATGYRLYFTGENNFRKGVPYPVIYKGGRPDKPIYYKQVKDYITKNYKTETVDTIEADDMLGIAATYLGTDMCVICSVDKDLKQIPGKHYNLAEQTFEYVTEKEANFNYWQQVLTGDSVDNIVGIRGVGPKKAQKLLESCPPEEWEPMILREYEKAFGDQAASMLEANKKLLYVLREMPKGG